MSIPNEASTAGTSANQIPNVPLVSFASIGNLSDLLKDLPLVRPIDSQMLDLEVEDSLNVDLNLDKLKLIDNKQQFEKSAQLLNSNDSYLVDILTKTLSQIDTSKITLKQQNTNSQSPSSSSSSSSSKKAIYFSPLLQTSLLYNPKLFNGALNEPFLQFQQQQQQQQRNLVNNQVQPALQIQSNPPPQQQQQTTINQQHHQVQQQQPELQVQPQTQVTNQIEQKTQPIATNNNYVQQEQPQIQQTQLPGTSSQPSNSSSSTPVITNNNNSNISSNNNNPSSYQIVSDPKKLCVKISKLPDSYLTNNNINNNVDKSASSPTTTTNQTSNASDTIKASKFYSSSSNSTSKQSTTNSSSNKTQNTPNKISSNTQNSNINNNNASNSHKKVDKVSSQLSTWQADIKSQLSLPDDFTPELIQQLASEGYDIVSALGSGARKSRQTKQQFSFNHHQQSSSNQRTIDDSSDDSDDNQKRPDNEYNPSKKGFKQPQNAFDNYNQNNKHLTPTKQSNHFQSPNIPNRSNHQRRQDLSAGQDPTDHPSYKRFNQMLDDLLDSYEQDLQQMNTLAKVNKKSNKNNDNESETSPGAGDEIPPEYLLTRQTCADLVQEAFKLNTYSIMNLIRKENLLKLQNLLFYNIKDGIRSLHLMNEDSMNTGSEQDKLLKEILVDKLLRASDCSIISLIIMTSPKISKELVIEDIIEQITTFVKINLTETIFPHYDSVYKTSNSHQQSSSTSSSKRKLLNQFQNPQSGSSKSGSSNSSTAKHINHFYNRMREILSLISDLITQIDLTDTIVITLTSLSVMCFFVENINDLQLESLKILTNLFSRYPKHRQLVLDDILSSLIKLHTNKRNSRSYKCFNGDSIQMFSALILQLIQCEVSIINHENMSTNDESKNSNYDELTFEEKETYLLTSYDQSTETAKKFLTVFFSKCKVKQADFDFRPIFENFIQDLLITVNKPEWPVSEVLLNLLGIILVNQIQNEQSDVQSRVNSLEYLGQIVSQLRKDSLEYQKNPERIEKMLEKFKAPTTLNEESIFSLQAGLISYISSLVSNDQSLKFSKYYLVSQWVKELNQLNLDANPNIQEHGQDRVQAHAELEQSRKRIYSLLEQKLDTQSPGLDPAEAFILSKYLTSLKKTLDKNFDYYLLNILNLTGGGSDVNTPTQVRSKAIKCLSLIIEADPQILLKQKVFSCVESNFLHQTISVREASVDLIGRFITIMPELTNHYYKLLSDRILDVGVSVRKRVIKIFRDICLNQPDFEYLSEICVKILRRINDEDAIKKLVIDTFYSIWFTPVSSKELLLKRVLSLVDVISEFNVITNPASMEIFESLFSSLIVNQNPTNGQSGIVKEENDVKPVLSENLNEKELLISRSKDVEKSSKKIVDCLIENVLNTEANTNSTPQAYKRLVACFSTLYLFSKIKPDYFITHAEILLPYLNIKSTNANDNQIINSAAKILECVVPLLQSPSNSFLISLEESLCKLIFQGGMMIVSSCISCLGTVVNKLTNNYKLAADCMYKFYNNTSYLKRTVNPQKPLEANTKPMLFRVLFTLGLLSKHFDVESDEFKDFKICTKQDLFQIFLYFINNFETDVQQKALIGLGSFLTRNSDYMIRDEIKALYLKYIKGNENQIPFSLKSQVFANLTDYLNEEDQRNLAKSVELTKIHLKDDLKEMLDVQSGMASTIIQSYLKPILESYLTSNLALRLSVFNCLSMILNQGLVYPIECVPYLIAMTTDSEKKIQTKALSHLTNLQKAHPNFVQSKSIAGVNISFLLQKIIKTSALNQMNSTNNSNSTNNDLEQTVIRGYSESNEILSLNHHLYTLLRTNRSYRRAFIQQLLKMFDDSSISRNHTTLAHMLFITDNLAYFPYQLLDEPLYLIHQIDLIISVTGINLLQTFKENLLNHKANDEKKLEQIKSESIINGQYTDIDLMSQLECPDEADDNQNQMNNNTNNQLSSNGNTAMNQNTNNQALTQSASSSKHLDDDDETFDTVYNNLPEDLKPLKECMYKTQGCCLLLILKQFLKEVYTINDSKIQNYSPTDTAKVNDRPLTSRKTNRKFNPKQIIDYMLNYECQKKDDELVKQSLVKEYLEFKELILSIDQEEMNKIDENKPNKPNIEAKMTVLQQKLFEGIEKTSARPTSNTGTPGGHASGQDSTQATPRSKIKHKSAARSLSSSAKKSSNKKRKRKKDSDESSGDSDLANSDFDDES